MEASLRKAERSLINNQQHPLGAREARRCSVGQNPSPSCQQCQEGTSQGTDLFSPIFRRGYQCITPVSGCADPYLDERAPRFPLPLLFYVPQNQTWVAGGARAPSPCPVHGGGQQDQQAGCTAHGFAQPPARLRCSLSGSDRAVLAASSRGSSRARPFSGAGVCLSKPRYFCISLHLQPAASASTLHLSGGI